MTWDTGYPYNALGYPIVYFVPITSPILITRFFLNLRRSSPPGPEDSSVNSEVLPSMVFRAVNQSHAKTWALTESVFDDIGGSVASPGFIDDDLDQYWEEGEQAEAHEQDTEDVRAVPL
ncbi:hypothetical protein FOMPIDRAFT_90871 [Fomitopsis schrenkii]|uniref:Uncharacterized protein n=1 Tax=Fomitopsis schrenkii TaxID=2126942 RepID=S8F4Y1_FOMSC|nr:hypothetical protein FOMPIDRAFT_90871 [Fomitopsis schrenkii]